MTDLDPDFVAASRRRDLLLTLVMLGILLTPAWLVPTWLSVPWQIGVAVVGVPALYLSWNHAPWVPTPRAELPRILAALQLSEGDRCCDLGSGDGRMVLWVRAATGATCTGIEASPLLALLARLRVAVQGDGGTTVRLGNLYAEDLSAYDVVYVWGTAYSVGTPEFGAFAARSMRPGSRLVSYHTPVAGWEPTAVDEGGLRPIYTYIVPPSSEPASP